MMNIRKSRRFPRQCAHWLGMTWFFDKLKGLMHCISPLFIRFWRIDQPNHIIRRKIVKLTKFDKIINLQFSPAGFNMAVSLLRFVKQFADFCLCQIPVFPDVFQPGSVIHTILLPTTVKIFLTIAYSVFEY